MRKPMTLLVAGAVLAAAVLVAPVWAQSLEQRISTAGDGSVQLRFASRAGVCGDGRGSIGAGEGTFVRQHSSGSSYGEGREWCVPGPVRLLLTVREGAVSGARLFVGGNDSSAGVHDLGVVSTTEAVGYLLALAPGAPGRVGESAVFAAVLADSVTPWAALFPIARGEDIPRRTREGARFWLSRAAAAAADHRPIFAEYEGEESADDEVRGAAIFALSQQPREEGVPALIRVARTSARPTLRGKALFWLGQSGDPRALDLFAELLNVK